LVKIAREKRGRLLAVPDLLAQSYACGRKKVDDERVSA
jgi:hypothetical protein